MSSRVTRSRARSETPQVTDFFKTTKNTRLRGEKKIIEEAEPQQTTTIRKKKKATKVKEEKSKECFEVKSSGPVAQLFEKKASRTRARTPSRQAELSTYEVTGTPPKKTREAIAEEQDAPVLPAENDVILENPNQQKSAIEELMEASAKQKKTTFRTVSDWQASMAETGGAATKTIHAQSLKNKTKQVDELVEALKSPKKKALPSTISPVKSKAARSLFSPKKSSVPDYVLPGFNVQKSAEKIREEQDDAYEEDGKRMTAEFLKISQLTEEVKQSVREPIKLPSAYELLVDGFKCVDKITSILQGQNRSCMASELFKNVKNNSGRDFSELQLAQIMHVYPEAHKVEMRETKKAFGQGGKYELEVKPNLVDDLEGFLKGRAQIDNDDDLPLVCPPKLLSPKKSPRKQIPAMRMPEIDGRKRLDAARMRDRAYVFRYKLTKIVLSHHASYLEEQGFPEMPNMKRMHPAFRPDKHCPPLPQAKLPEPPHQKSSQHMSMKEALDKYSDVNEVKLPSFVQKAYEDLKSPLKATTGASGTVPVSPKKFSEMQKGQKTSVLDRIRKKAELQKAADACIDKDLEKRAMRLELLKDRYARIVCNRYTTKKVQTMKLDAVVEFVRFSSSNPQSIADCVDHLKLLCEVAPMYVTEVVTLNEKHLRFSDNNLEAIVELLEEDYRKTKDQIKEQRNQFLPKLTQSLTPRPSKAARSLKFP